MSNILILGATGQIAQLVTAQLLNVQLLDQELVNDQTHHLFLYCRQPQRLNCKNAIAQRQVDVIQADVNDTAQLEQAMIDIDVVYANLSGHDLGQQAQNIVNAMQKEGVKRLIFITSMGIYNEVTTPAQNLQNNPALKPYRALADVVESSGLDYTLVRPGWFVHAPNSKVVLSQKGEAFTGMETSKQALVEFICDLIDQPTQHIQQSVGIYNAA